MSDKVFNFDDQLRVGNVGESTFARVYESLSPKKSDDLKVDFVLADGKKVELKTDTYDMNRTPNFFMESQTVSGTKTNLGGPWRSKEHGINYFVYFFLNNRIFFWFDPNTLCEFLDKYITDNGLRPISIPNKDKWGGYYEARGYKIPRGVVEHLRIKEPIV